MSTHNIEELEDYRDELGDHENFANGGNTNNKAGGQQMPHRIQLENPNSTFKTKLFPTSLKNYASAFWARCKVTWYLLKP